MLAARFAQIGRWQLRAEQDQRLASVLQQAGDGSVFVAGRGDGAEREFVAGGVGGRIEAADEVAVEGVLDAEHDTDQPAPAAAQHAGSAVGSVSQLLGRRRTCSRFAGLAPATSRITIETSGTETPARAATSARVTRRSGTDRDGSAMPDILAAPS